MSHAKPDSAVHCKCTGFRHQTWIFTSSIWGWYKDTNLNTDMLIIVHVSKVYHSQAVFFSQNNSVIQFHLDNAWANVT